MCPSQQLNSGQLVSGCKNRDIYNGNVARMTLINVSWAGAATLRTKSTSILTQLLKQDAIKLMTLFYYTSVG